jgi:DNA-binding XRE family transcriptional regulator/predicted RNase H-like HicB family nuclease
VEYIGIVTKEGKQTLVEFPDCPGCQTFAEEGEDLYERAEEALVGWLETSMQLGRLPSQPRGNIGLKVGQDAILIQVPLRLATAIIIRRARIAAGMTQKQLANISGIAQPVIARLESSKSNPTIDTLGKVSAALGARLEFSIAAIEARASRAERAASKQKKRTVLDKSKAAAR